MNKFEELHQTIRRNIHVVGTWMSFADSSFTYACGIYLPVPRRSRSGVDAAAIQLYLDTGNWSVSFYISLIRYDDIFQTDDTTMLHNPTQAKIMMINGPKWLQSRNELRNFFIFQELKLYFFFLLLFNHLILIIL